MKKSICQSPLKFKKHSQTLKNYVLFWKCYYFNQSEEYLFTSKRKKDNIKRKIEYTLKIHLKRGFDFTTVYRMSLILKF